MKTRGLVRHSTVFVTGSVCPGLCKDASRNVHGADGECDQLEQGHSGAKCHSLLSMRTERLPSPDCLLPTQLFWVIVMPPRAHCPTSPKPSLLSWKTEMLITVPTSQVRVKNQESWKWRSRLYVQCLPHGQHLINGDHDKKKLGLTSLCHL